MTTDELVKTLNTASLTHLLAVDAAVTTLASLPKDDPARVALKLALANAQGRMGLAKIEAHRAKQDELDRANGTTTFVDYIYPDRSEQYEAALERVAAEMAVIEESAPVTPEAPVRTVRSGFTVEENEAILAKHYPWALPRNNR